MLTFCALQTLAQAQTCARLMAESEPWLTLRRDYDSLLKAVQNPAREAYLALQEEEIAGFALLNFQGAFTGYLQSICVAPGWRGKGAGTALMEFAEKRIFRQSPNVFLCVSSFNLAAQRFYRRRGYETIGVLRQYLAPEYDEILMRKSISPLLTWKPETA